MKFLGYKLENVEHKTHHWDMAYEWHTKMDKSFTLQYSCEYQQ